MKKHLHSVALIQAGILAKPETGGTVCFLQSKHFSQEGELVQELYPELMMNDKISRYLLQDGDVLFAAKGNKNVAVVYYSHYGQAVASQTFLVARIHDNCRPVLLPEYLAWYINNPKTLNQLKAAATGSNIQAITTTVLKELEIEIPSLQKQHAILKIHELRTKEINLRVQIEALRETLIQTQLLQAAGQ